MKQLVTRAALFGIFMLIALNVWAAKVADAQALIETTTNEVLETLKADSSNIYNLVDKLVLPHFDFEKMSKLVLAKHWRKVSEDQQIRFAEAFRGLLVRTYSSALVKAAKKVDKITYTATPKGRSKRAKVLARVYQTRVNKPLKIDYAMYFDKKNEVWKVYNITVAGVSLVTNYRSEFARDIKTIGIDGLIEKTQNKKPKEVK